MTAMWYYISMSADLTPSEPVEASFGTRPYFDPVTAFNEMNEHVAPGMPSQPERVLRIDGDPAAIRQIVEAIKTAGGAIPFSEYMDLALYGDGGYYSQGKVGIQSGTGYGHDGQFTTAPETSDDFSRAIRVGVCAILGAIGPQPFNLVEFGGGTGRMMKDVLAAMRNEDPRAYGFVNAFIEDYGGMNPRQARILGSAERSHPGSYAARSSEDQHRQDLAKVQWASGAELDAALDNGRPTIVMANEVPDAVKADVVRNDNGVLEQKFVAIGDGEYDGQLVERWLPLTPEVQAYINTYGVTVEPGKEVAVSPAAVAVHRRMCQLVRRGGLITIDYGADGPTQRPSIPWTPAPIKMVLGHPTGSLQAEGAVRTYPGKHSPLQLVGEIDLTYDPDFRVLRRVAQEEGLGEAFYGTQDELMLLCGLPSRDETEAILEQVGDHLSENSKRRVIRTQSLLTKFRALVVTRGVTADFSAKRALLPGYREFFTGQPISDENS